MSKLGDATELTEILSRLAATIDARAGASPETSYTAKLLSRGERKCAQKLVEEAGELAIAIAAEPDDAVAAEAGDVLFHLLVGLRSRGVSLNAVASALESRESQSGLDEKAGRKKV